MFSLLTALFLNPKPVPTLACSEDSRYSSSTLEECCFGTRRECGHSSSTCMSAFISLVSDLGVLKKQNKKQPRNQNPLNGPKEDLGNLSIEM